MNSMRRRKVIITILLLFFILSTINLFADESKSVLLRWKVKEGDVLGFKTSLDEIKDKKDDKSLKKSDSKEGFPKFKLPDKYSMIAILKPDGKDRFFVELVFHDIGKISSDSDNFSKSIYEMLKKREGKVQLRGEINSQGKITSFYLPQGQKNLLALFFQLPGKPVKIGDTWSIDVNLISMGAIFDCKKSRRRNLVKLISLRPTGNGDIIAVMEYDIYESIMGTLLGPTSMEMSFKGRGEFLVKEGKWKNFSGIMETETRSILNSSVKQRFAMIPMKKVPEKYKHLRKNRIAFFDACDAIGQGDIDRLRILIEKYPDILNQTLLNGDTLLHIASGINNINAVKLLVEKGADVNVENLRKATPLESASGEEVRKFLENHGARGDFSKAHFYECQSNLKNIGTALEMYKLDKKRYPESLGELAPQYLREIPTCPSAKTDTYSKGYETNSRGSAYTVFCSGHHHKDMPLPMNYPRYTSVNRLEDAPKGWALKPAGIADAIKKGNRENISALMEKYPDLLTITDYRGYTPLIIAVDEGKKDMVEFLISQGADVNASGEKGLRPLHTAAQKGNADIAKLLILKGSDVNIVDKNKYTPLHYAVEERNTDIVKLLIENGADVNARTTEGVQPIHISSKYGDIEIAKILLAKGADLNSKDKLGSKSIQYAAGNGRNRMIEFLLSEGVDVNDGKGKLTALHNAAWYGKISTARFLIEKGADVNSLNANKSTPLHLASGMGHDKIAEILIDRGANINAVNKDGSTPIHYAAEKGMIKVVRLLLSRGADFDKKDGERNTPLHKAVGSGYTDIIMLLIERGSDVNIKNKKGETPLSRAKKLEFEDIVEILEEAGAK